MTGTVHTCDAPVYLRCLLILLGRRMELFRERLLQASERGRHGITPILRSGSRLRLKLFSGLSRIGVTTFGGSVSVNTGRDDVRGASRSSGCGCWGDIFTARGGTPSALLLLRLRGRLSSLWFRTATFAAAFCFVQLFDSDVRGGRDWCFGCCHLACPFSCHRSRSWFVRQCGCWCRMRRRGWSVARFDDRPAGSTGKKSRRGRRTSYSRCRRVCIRRSPSRSYSGWQRRRKSRSSRLRIYQEMRTTRPRCQLRIEVQILTINSIDVSRRDDRPILRRTGNRRLRIETTGRWN